jgi:hypothetical protein
MWLNRSQNGVNSLTVEQSNKIQFSIPSDCLKFYADGSLFEGKAGSEVLSEILYRLSQGFFCSWNVHYCLSGRGLHHFGWFRLQFEGGYDW